MGCAASKAVVAERPKHLQLFNVGDRVAIVSNVRLFSPKPVSLEDDDDKLSEDEYGWITLQVDCIEGIYSVQRANGKYEQRITVNELKLLKRHDWESARQQPSLEDLKEFPELGKFNVGDGVFFNDDAVGIRYRGVIVRINKQADPSTYLKVSFDVQTIYGEYFPGVPPEKLKLLEELEEADEK